MNVQYRVVVAKKGERIDGPDDADVVITAPLAVAGSDGFDATVEYMRGQVKATGAYREVLALLKSGEPTAALSALASQP